MHGEILSRRYYRYRRKLLGCANMVICGPVPILGCHQPRIEQNGLVNYAIVKEVGENRVRHVTD